MTEGEEVVALIKSYTDQGLVPQDDPQLASKLAAIKAKYAQQPTQTQQQTTTQDTGALANIGTDTQQQDTQPEMVYGSDGSLQSLIGGKPRFLTFQDPETGRVFQYNYEKQEYQGLGPDYYKADNLQLIGAVGEDRSKEGEFVSVNIDPTKFQYGGVNTPEQADKLAAEANREPGYESGGGGIFYTIKDDDGNETQYYTPDNTGQGIPVGATNITTDPTGATGQPSLIKGFSGYHTTQEAADKDMIPESTTSITEALTSPFVEGGQGSGVFDLGQMFGLNKDQLTLMNPDSNQFNLGKFFNQTKSFGTQNFLRSQSTDVLNDIINQGNFFNALAGKNFELADGSFYYDKIYNVINPNVDDPDDLSRYGVDPSRGYGTPDDPLRLDEFGGFNELTGLSGGAIQGYDVNQAQDFLDSLGETLGTGDRIYSNTAFGTDPFNISGGDDSNALQYNYAYSQRPLTAQAVRAYKGGLGPYANVQYLTRYGYNPEIGDEILRYDEASGVYFDPITGLPIKPERLEGFALSDPETVELGGTESVYRGQMTTNPVTGEKLYYDAEGNPVTEEQYQLFTEPMETGVT